VLIGSLFVTQIGQANAKQDLGIAQVWLVVGSAACLGLWSLFFFGCFGGQQRYEWENLYKAIVSIGFITSIFGSLLFGFSINPSNLSQSYFAAICTGLIFLICRFAKQSQLRIPTIKDWHFPTIKSYMRGMYGLSIWQVGILMVSGFDLWIVAKVDFAAVPGYSIALSFLVFLSGTIAAIAGPFLPRFSAELAQTNHGQFKSLFLSYQGKIMMLIAVIFIGLFALPYSVWLMLLKDSAPTFNLVFPILLLATCLRLMTLLYALSVIAANAQNRVILSPLLEGVINIASSILLAYWLGPIGVAIGTLIGSVACLSFHALYNIPRTTDVIPLTPLSLIYPWKT
jgi:O-antigen/teichoic acid export membrane protein